MIRHPWPRSVVRACFDVDFSNAATLVGVKPNQRRYHRNIDNPFRYAALLECESGWCIRHLILIYALDLVFGDHYLVSEGVSERD